MEVLQFKTSFIYLTNAWKYPVVILWKGVLSSLIFYLSVWNTWLYLIVIPSLYIEERNSSCKILIVFCNTLEELSYGLHLLSLLVPDICSVKKKNDVLFCKTIPCVSPLAKFTIHYVREKMFRIFWEKWNKELQLIVTAMNILVSVNADIRNIL